MALSDNLVFYSDMTDATSTTVTENTGTYTLTKASSGNPVEATGKVGDGQTFTSDYIESTFNPRTTIGTGDLTVAFWFNASQIDARRSLINFTDNTAFSDALNCQLGRASDSYYINWAARDGVSGYVEISDTGHQDSSWHLFVGTRAGTTGAMYIDNTLVSSSTNAEWGVNVGAHMGLGSIYTTNAQQADGVTMDEIGIWTQALDSTERSDLWNSGSGATYSDKQVVELLNLSF